MDVAGEGELLVFLHGIGGNKTNWHLQLPEFSNYFKTVAWDARGYGGSDDYEGDLDFSDFSRDLERVLDHFEAGKAHLCGLSMGGYIGWEFWKNFPERICRLIQCDTRSIGDTELVARGRRQMAKRITEQGPNGSALAADGMIPKLFSEHSAQAVPERVSQLRGVIAASDYQMIAETQFALANRANANDWLPDINIPTLLICGEHDAISPADEMRVIADTMPNATIKIIENVGHMAPLEHPQAVNNLIRQFLKQTDSSC